MPELDLQGYYNDALGIFGGNASLFRLAFVGLIVWFGWGHWTKIFAYVKEALAKLLAGVKVPQTTAPAAEVMPSPTNDPLPSLQAMTVWAVHNSTPEVLSKVTALYQDLQAAGKAGK